MVDWLEMAKKWIPIVLDYGLRIAPLGFGLWLWRKGIPQRLKEFQESKQREKRSEAAARVWASVVAVQRTIRTLGEPLFGEADWKDQLAELRELLRQQLNTLGDEVAKAELLIENQSFFASANRLHDIAEDGFAASRDHKFSALGTNALSEACVNAADAACVDLHSHLRPLALFETPAVAIVVKR